MNSPEGKQHLERYPIEGFPYICIIDATTGERVKTWSIVIGVAEFIESSMEIIENAKTRILPDSAPLSPLFEGQTNSDTDAVDTDDSVSVIELDCTFQLFNSFDIMY